MGGLGNQLFQYAAGKALAIKHNTELKVDLSFLNNEIDITYTKRNLELDVFNTSYSVASDEELELFTKKNILQKILKKYFNINLTKFYIANQTGFEYNIDFLSYPDNTLLIGFWQSQNFFSTIREILLKELTIKKTMSQDCLMAHDAIVNSNSVSLHIRRGDYVSDKNANSFHGILPLEYYYNAMNYLNQLTSNLKVFVFSDDIDWVKSNLKLKNESVYIDFNKNENSVFDMYLMSLCKYNVIANSSFSWWGAWLNQHPNKVVISPKLWFVDNKINTKDLIPSSWIQL